MEGKKEEEGRSDEKRKRKRKRKRRRRIKSARRNFGCKFILLEQDIKAASIFCSEAFYQNIYNPRRRYINPLSVTSLVHRQLVQQRNQQKQDIKLFPEERNTTGCCGFETQMEPEI